MSIDPTFDRRKFPRLNTDSLVSIAQLDSRSALAHSLDFSLAGVRFQCVGLAVSKGDTLKVTFTFGERSVAVVGQVVRADALDDLAQDVAMQFLKTNPQTHAFLAEQLAASEPADGGDLESEERRGMRRIRVESIVSVERASLIDVVAQAQDLSVGGVHFVVEGLDLALGDVLRVTLSCGGPQVSVVGQLVRVTDIDEFKQECALSFLEVDDLALHTLMRYLEEGAPR